MQGQIKLLAAVKETLERVTVSGKDNLDRMLGCIRAVEKVRLELMQKEKELKDNAKSGMAEQQRGNSEDAAGTV